MVSKEYWANLSDEDKSKIIRRFCEINDIGPDFDYAKVGIFLKGLNRNIKNLEYTEIINFGNIPF